MSTIVQPVNWKGCDAFADAMIEEYKKARQKFGPFDNGHEGLAVIWEEFEELKTFVFGKNQTPEQVENARRECVQLAAMAMAFALEVL
jgi:hypothetical protein